MSSNIWTFDYQFNQSPKLASKVASSWYEFSNFVPVFLKELVTHISNRKICQRIEEIILEETGDGHLLQNHAQLYKSAMFENMIDLKIIKTNSISLFQKNYKDKIEDVLVKESFCVGVSYGLEIIAEQNIKYLLYYSAQDKTSYAKLEKTLFFQIHLENEIEHINKCMQNKGIVTQDEKSKRSFDEGVKISLEFWNHFWKEALNEED